MDNNDGIGNSEDGRNTLTPEIKEKLRLFIEEKLPLAELVRMQRLYQNSPEFCKHVEAFYKMGDEGKKWEETGKESFGELCQLFSPLIRGENGNSPVCHESFCRPSPTQVESMWQKIEKRIHPAS